MKVVLIRHGKVNFSWKSWYTSDQFDEACVLYDKAPIMKLSYSIPDAKYSSYYISALSRTGETAQSSNEELEEMKAKLLSELDKLLMM